MENEGMASNILNHGSEEMAIHIAMAGDALTAHDNKVTGHYKKVNAQLNMLYNALMGHATLAHEIFSRIIDSIWKDEIVNKYNRIYNNEPLNAEIIFKQLNPSKFSGSKKDVDSLIRKNYGYLSNKINYLHENNVFYLFSIRGCNIFFLERHFYCWKVYNPNAYVVPHTLTKILNLAPNVIAQMSSFLADEQKNISIEDVECRFGRFINEMINKMNPEVAFNIPHYDNGENILEYCKSTHKLLKSKGKYAGFRSHPDFLNLLPLFVRERIIDRMKKNTSGEVVMKKSMNTDDSLVTIEPAQVKTAELKWENYDQCYEVDAFRSEKDMTRYYRDFVKFFHGQTKISVKINFNRYDTDLTAACDILDLLKENNRLGDKEFLKKWMEYFCVNYLKGKKVGNPNDVAMKTFKNTFREFNQKSIAL